MFNFIYPMRFVAVGAAALLISAGIAPMSSATTATENPCTTEGRTVTCTWDNPGTYDWQVPDGVTSAKFELYGAQGGSRLSNSGGLGGYTLVPDMRIQPQWKSLSIRVGGQGGPAQLRLSGGYNGGGKGSLYLPNFGAGGGGASDISRSSTHPSRLVVAGGGGGASASNAGGAGGGTGAGSGHGEAGGEGATQAEAGRGGSFGSCTAADGDSERGGASYPCMIEKNGGGGGGGGWFGGGGGTANSGGGGGSGGVYPAYPGVYETAVGVNEGNGKVVITYTLPQE